MKELAISHRNGNVIFQATRHWEREALAELVKGTITPMALAQSIYDVMKPRTSKGGRAVPKPSNSACAGVDISSLGRAPAGGDRVKRRLQMIFYIYEKRDRDNAAVDCYIRGGSSLTALEARMQAMALERARAECEGTLKAFERKQKEKQLNHEAVLRIREAFGIK